MKKMNKTLIAVVAAVDEDTCNEAMKLIKVEYEVLKPVLNFEEAYENESVIHPEDGIKEMFPIGFEPKKNVAAAYEMHVGDVDKVLNELGKFFNILIKGFSERSSTPVVEFSINSPYKSSNTFDKV